MLAVAAVGLVAGRLVDSWALLAVIGAATILGAVAATEGAGRAAD